MKKEVSKLVLAKETLQLLTEPTLDKVLAGNMPPATEGMLCSAGGDC